MPDEVRRFEEVATITDVSGITCRISRRLKNNELTFCFVKVFKRDREVESTAFMPMSLWGDFRDMVDKVEKKLLEIQADDKAKAEAKIKGHAKADTKVTVAR